MTIIIGSGSSTPEPESPLNSPEVDLPHPGSAPAGRRLLEDDKLRALLKHESGLVRTFALEQIAHRTPATFAADLIARIQDEDPMVALESISIIEQHKLQEAVDALLQRFEDASGDIAAACAGALGQLAPERLLDAVRNRGRLDDNSYAATATALAVIGSQEVIAFLDKALNRARALPPERRGALYGAALLSGDATLAGRVISLAIEDSKSEAPENSAFPTRGALGAMTGLPLAMARSEAGLELFDNARELLEEEALPLLEGDAKSALTAALKQKRAGEVVAALAFFLKQEVAQGSSDIGDLGTMPQRRKGLLEALIARSEAIGALELPQAALFVAAATKAASIIVAGETPESKSAGMIALSKALEGKKSPEELAQASTEVLTELFKALSPREMRRVHTIITRESFYRDSTIRSLMNAAIDAGHGAGLIEACAEHRHPRTEMSLVKVARARPEAMEPMVLELLEARPIEAQSASLALMLAEEIRTEKIGLVLGRRFLELREHDRGALARAILRTGDERLLEVLESRAFAGEPEEVAWAVLSLVQERPVEGHLQEAIQRLAGGPSDRRNPELIRLPLTCKACKETLTYGFEKVFLDVEAKDESGDPAFVGDLNCKACGAEDNFEQTETSQRILMDHMLQYLNASRAGVATEPPKVQPAQTKVLGQPMGMAQALRTLDAELERKPESLPALLERAHLRAELKRSGVEDDLKRVFALETDQPEALSLQSMLALRRRDFPAALDLTVAALRKLKADPNVRMYHRSAPELQESLLDRVAELELVSELTPPDDLELTEARARLQERIAAIEAYQRQEEEAQQPRAPQPQTGPQGPQGPELEAAIAKASRNDPCPCGNGKKFKKCHGKGR